ncbi:hypothetical protein J421_1314 [Gemmatirosa kalamazoonensis]|uniref:Cytochrome c family protein n=1 Tax=Gemmatirosa kalamazoonensis TaxID=861299 RepID=W0RDI2_9BACT|nr:hypothetical protein [Gemmatirosa kalamazoonensis]AHG88851.1 hypothetical protein J421_1314 [Gemmatirosa kalamazoonensis]
MRTTLALLLLVAAPLHAQHHHADTAFASMQARGKTAMGVDQYASSHRFDTLADGGRIALVSGRDDSAAVAAIRTHFRTIAAAFARGDFATPGFVHDGPVPGTRVMAEKRSAITYEARDLPRGGELRIRTGDPEARKAIAEFLAFQRREHRSGGRRDD